MTSGPYRASPRTPDVLVCAGLDPSGGAGLIADTRVISLLGARPCGIVTALTVQNTTGVVDCQALDPELIGHQLAFLMTDIEVRSVKIGMIGSTAVAKAIAEAMHMTAAPVVWDPVLYPSRGDVPLVDSLFGEAIAALRPHLAMITPNARELAFLTNQPVSDLASALAAGHVLARRLDTAVLVKGGHVGEASDESIDSLVQPSGSIERFVGARVRDGQHVHGTGCAMSAAIAALLALGRDTVEACREAKKFVAERIASPTRPGRGAASAV
jgi:hydroxymethylpyrimidine/phosphomethylpyrimidine kinase